jgi:hypothetical protein
MNRRRFLKNFARWGRSSLAIAAGFALVPHEVRGQSDERSQFFEIAFPIFSETKSVRSFALPDRIYAAAADLTLEKLGPPPISREVDESFKEFLVSRLTQESSYLFGVRKAMRFYADSGLIFEGSANKNVFLISRDFSGGRLVLDRPLDPRTFIVNLDPIFPALLERLNKSLQR